MAPGQYLPDGHESYAGDLAEHKLEWLDGRYDDLEYAVVLFLDDRCHDHLTVYDDKHIEDHVHRERQEVGEL